MHAGSVHYLVMPREHFSRRSLPHWYMPGAAHFVTYRLVGSLPQSVLRELRQRRDEVLAGPRPESETQWERHYQSHKRLFAEYDARLDAQSKNLWLQRNDIAAVIRENLYHHHQGQFTLLAYCVMPNHVHVLLRPLEGNITLPDALDVGEMADAASPLAGIMHSLKSYTANEANRRLGREGAFWQRESYDHWVRDDEELERIVYYIRYNPVKARLVTNAEDWPWGSCHDRFQKDGDTSGWLNL